VPTSATSPAPKATPYLVLARKYRPQRFQDLVGQEHVARTLGNAIALGRVHHAFLFTGARGVGKTSAARILARALCCVKGPTATPCGECDFCTEIVSGQSVDVVEIDGASNRGVEDARNLREAVRYAPSKGRKKVYIIDEVHMFTAEAFNALLKTLEEPPPHVVFILATTEVHKIPITILSRCQRYDFKLLPTVRLVEHMTSILAQENIPFEGDALRLLARQAGGSARDSLSLLDQIIAFVGDSPITHDKVVEVLGVADRRLLQALHESVLAREPARALRLLAEAIDKGIDLVQLSRSFLGYIHDAEVVNLVDQAGDLVDATPEEIAELRALAGKMPRGLATTLFDRWARAVDEAGKSPTPRLLLEMALVDLCFAEPLVPLGDLLARLGDLEARLQGGAPPPARPPGGRPPGDPGARPAPAPSRSSGPDAPPAFREPAPRAVAPAPGPAETRPPASSPSSPSSPSSARAPSPAPEAAPAPAAAPGTPEDAWNLLRLRLQDRPPLAAALDHAAVASWDAGRVVLTVPGRLPLDRLEKDRAVLEAALREVTGAATALELRLGGAPGSSSALASEVAREADALEKDRARREQEARQHPMIRKAQELFGVSAREVKLP
jgi:DNA polymerase-3 subunit gamma/tau